MRQASAASDSDPKKGKGLANKVMKMKEDITREVLNRATAMADREERAVLMTAVNALNKSDTTRALKVRLSFPSTTLRSLCAFALQKSSRVHGW